MSVVIRPVSSKREKRIFLTFPWRVYKDDPLWIPPLLPERAKAIDPAQGRFFKDGEAEFFIAWRGKEPVGTVCLAEDYNRTRTFGKKECMLNFIEFVEDYRIFEALCDFAATWAEAHGMRSLYGPYSLDREDNRALLVEGRDRPAPILCGHHPVYYQDFFERYGFEKDAEDGLAYAIDLDPEAPKIKRVFRLAKMVRKRHPEFSVRSANMADKDAEIDRIVDLQNRGLAHFEKHVPYTRNAIEAMILPLLDVVDLDLVLFAEVNGEAAGFLPGVPNFNELLINLNGLRYPWDYFRYLRHRNLQPKCLSVKSVVVPPEYWDTGLAVLLFAEMTQRAIERGYTWADLSLTSEENPDTWPLAHNMGAKIYKRYRVYKKVL